MFIVVFWLMTLCSPTDLAKVYLQDRSSGFMQNFAFYNACSNNADIVQFNAALVSLYVQRQKLQSKYFIFLCFERTTGSKLKRYCHVFK
jgi:hypothetical protein